MQEYLRLNDHKFGFANHPTEGTGYTKGALDTEVLVRSGKLRINLLTPALDLAALLPPGAPEFYRTQIPFLRLVTYQDVAVPGGHYGNTLNCPRQGDPRPSFEVYGLPGYEKFYGTVTVDEGVLRIVGEIKNEDGTLVLPLEAVKHFTPKPLLPPRKRYKLEEARRASPLEVYELQVGTGAFEGFPTEILAYKKLEYLWFGGRAQVNFTELPREFFDLTRLHSLLLYGHNLRSLPPAIGKLQQLEELVLASGPLTEVPAEVGQLKALRQLSFRYNQLTDLPEAISTLPALRELNIEGNNFKTLPKGLARVRTLKIDRKYRKLYTDDGYVSDNPKLVDHELYDLSRYPEALEKLEAAIARTPALVPGRELLLRYARMATYLVPQPGLTDIPLGHSRLGGAPDLPAGTEHPTGKNGELLVFHAQLNCAELAPYQAYLPRTGMLYFYVSDEEMVRMTTVRYEPVTTNLRRFVYTEATEFTDANMNGYWRKPVAVVPENAVSFPDLYNAGNHGAERFPAVAHLFAEDETAAGALSDDTIEALDEATRALVDANPDTPRQKLPFAARELHSINGYVFTQHESPEEQAAAKFGGEPEDYLTLLNLESLGEFSFWDAGTLTYCVHKKDLAIGVFDRVGAFIESS